MDNVGDVEIDAAVVHETDAGLLLDYGGEEPVWVPKSLVEDNGDGTFSMPEWLAIEKEMV